MKVTTKLNKAEVKGTDTELTIEFDCTEEQLQQLARKTLVIAWQAIQRDAGKVPAVDTYKASDFFNKVRKPKAALTVDDLVKRAALDPEFAAEAIARLKALGMKI